MHCFTCTLKLIVLSYHHSRNPISNTILYFFLNKAVQDNLFASYSGIIFTLFEKEASFVINEVSRSRRLQMFFKISVLKNVTAEHLQWSPFLIKLQVFKKRLWHRYFLEKFAKFLRTAYFMEHVMWLFLSIL